MGNDSDTLNLYHGLLRNNTRNRPPCPSHKAVGIVGHWEIRGQDIVRQYASEYAWERCDGESGARFWWTPANCELKPFDAKKFCSYIVANTSAHNVLFIGDSITRLQASSLAHLLGANPYKRYSGSKCPSNGPPFRTKLTGEGFPKDDLEVNVCGSACLAMRRVDFLLGNDPSGNISLILQHAKWIHQFGIIVLNTGAHYRALGRWVEEAAEFYAKHARPGAVVVYRTTVPGHHPVLHTARNSSTLTSPSKSRKIPDAKLLAGSAVDGAPFVDLQTAETWLRAHPGLERWHYLDFEERNKRVVSTFQRVFSTRTDVEFLVLDAYSITIMQWAGHIDPLHHCIGIGPPDLWNVLLQYLVS